MPRIVLTHRRLLMGLLSFLLLFMQVETVRHALDHIGAELERSKYSALERPTGGACLECELLAAGTASTPASLPAPFAGIAAWIDVVAPVARPAIAAPSFYRSRAPRRLLQIA